MNRIRKFTKLISVVLVLSMLLGMNVFASSDNVHFDFPRREINLAPGDELHMYVWASDAIHDHDSDYPTYSVYMVPTNYNIERSKGSYAWSDFKCGNSYVDVYIGEDEVNTGFTLYFYIDGLDEYDTVNIHIVEPAKSDISYTKNNAIRKQMGLDPLPVKDTERKEIKTFNWL